MEPSDGDSILGEAKPMRKIWECDRQTGGGMEWHGRGFRSERRRFVWPVREGVVLNHPTI